MTNIDQLSQARNRVSLILDTAGKHTGSVAHGITHQAAQALANLDAGLERCNCLAAQNAELLAVLESLVDWKVCGIGSDLVIERARAVIAKATIAKVEDK